MNPPKRTKEQVMDFLTKCASKGSDLSAARLLRNHGRLEDDAMEYVIEYLAAKGE